MCVRLHECVHVRAWLGICNIEGDQIEVFNFLNGLENIDPNIFLEMKAGRITRGHDFKLQKRRSTVG